MNYTNNAIAGQSQTMLASIKSGKAVNITFALTSGSTFPANFSYWLSNVETASQVTTDGYYSASVPYSISNSTSNPLIFTSNISVGFTEPSSFIGLYYSGRTVQSASAPSYQVSVGNLVQLYPTNKHSSWAYSVNNGPYVQQPNALAHSVLFNTASDSFSIATREFASNDPYAALSPVQNLGGSSVSYYSYSASPVANTSYYSYENNLATGLPVMEGTTAVSNVSIGSFGTDLWSGMQGQPYAAFGGIYSAYSVSGQTYYSQTGIGGASVAHIGTVFFNLTSNTGTLISSWSKVYDQNYTNLTNNGLTGQYGGAFIFTPTWNLTTTYSNFDYLQISLTNSYAIMSGSEYLLGLTGVDFETVNLTSAGLPNYYDNANMTGSGAPREPSGIKVSSVPFLDGYTHYPIHYTNFTEMYSPYLVSFSKTYYNSSAIDFIFPQISNAVYGNSLYPVTYSFNLSGLETQNISAPFNQWVVSGTYNKTVNSPSGNQSFTQTFSSSQANLTLTYYTHQEIEYKPTISSFGISNYNASASSTVTFYVNASNNQSAQQQYLYLNFGDGTNTVTSPMASPWDFKVSHSYSSNGDYQVNGTVWTTGNGPSYGVNFSYRFEVHVGYSVSISSSQNFSEVGYKITFNSSVSDAVGPVSYLWSIDSYQYSTSSANFSFPSAGNYGIILKITDSEGFVTFAYFNESIVPNPTAKISAEYTIVDSNINDTFNAVNSTNGLSPYTYAWTINGKGFAGPQAITNFTTPDTYLISLTITDTDSISTTSYYNVTVVPDPVIVVSHGYSAVTRNTEFFANVTKGLSPYHVTWNIDNSLLSGFEANYTFLHTQLHNYTVTLTDSAGWDKTYSHNLTVNLYVAVASSAYQGLAPFSVQLSSTVSQGNDPQTVQYNYNWSLGNGNYSYLADPNVIYPVGNYTLNLEVNSTLGNGNASLSLQSLPPYFNANVSPNSNVTVDTLLHFNATPNWDAVEPYSFLWVLPDGITSTNASFAHDLIQFSPQVFVTLQFKMGSYQTNNTFEIYMTALPPVVNFSLPTDLPQGTALTLVAQASSPDSQITLVTWNAMGQTYSGSTATMVFSQAGNVTVTAYAQDALGLTSSVSKTVDVTPLGTTPTIHITPTSTEELGTTTYNVQVNSPVKIKSVIGLLDNSPVIFKEKSSSENNAVFYSNWSISISQAYYPVGNYPLTIIAYNSLGQSNSTNVTFVVGNTYGQQGFNLINFFGGETNFLTAMGLIVSVASVLMFYAISRRQEVPLGNGLIAIGHGRKFRIENLQGLSQKKQQKALKKAEKRNKKLNKKRRLL